MRNLSVAAPDESDLLSRPGRPDIPVAVTGIGIVSPLGIGREESWLRILSGDPAFHRIDHFSAERFGLERCVISRLSDEALSNIRERRHSLASTGRLTTLAASAALEATEEAGLAKLSSEALERVGLFIGVSMGGWEELETAVLNTRAGRKTRLRVNLGLRPPQTARFIAHELNLGGPALCIDTACASGASAVIAACRALHAGAVDLALAGGVEASLTPARLKLSHTLGALSKNFSSEPSRASRPFDEGRDGFVPSEGAAFLLLENLPHAEARGARPIAVISGFAEGMDAAHATRLSPEFVSRILRGAMDGSASPGWLNAHATSTPQGDAAEAAGIALAFASLGRGLPPVSAPKSVTGHMMAASGAMELAISALSLRDQVIPGTINLDRKDCSCLFEVASRTEKRVFDSCLSSSFGFGGPGCAVMLRNP